MVILIDERFENSHRTNSILDVFIGFYISVYDIFEIKTKCVYTNILFNLFVFWIDPVSNTQNGFPLRYDGRFITLTTVIVNDLKHRKGVEEGQGLVKFAGA